MKKAIVLTYPKLTKKDERLLKNTEIFKIACNWHSEQLNPHKRLIADKGIIEKVKLLCKQPILTLLEYNGDKQLEDCRHFPKRNSTLLSCVDYLIKERYTHILLIADNRTSDGKDINKKFQKHIYDTINQQKRFINIYKYSERGYFDIPHISIEEFLEMKKQTAEEKILGVEPQEREVFNDIFMFTDAYLFEVCTKGLDNHSVETGALLAQLLPPKKQQELLDGAKEVEYNGLIIKRITG